MQARSYVPVFPFSQRPGTKVPLRCSLYEIGLLLFAPQKNKAKLKKIRKRCNVVQSIYRIVLN